MSRREAYLPSNVCMDVIESLASLNICARAAGLSEKGQRSLIQNIVRVVCLCLLIFDILT